jgi:hypothetical protein
LGLQRATTALPWHNVGLTTQLDGFLSAPLPGGGGVVLCAFVCVVCILRRIMYDCFFFLYDMTVLLPLIFLLKNTGIRFSRPTTEQRKYAESQLVLSEDNKLHDSSCAFTE